MGARRSRRLTALGAVASHQVQLAATAHQLAQHPRTAAPCMIAMLLNLDSHVFNSRERGDLVGAFEPAETYLPVKPVAR
jgi:hypothetical protein